MTDSKQVEISGLWGRSFRPFFLGLAVFGALVIPWWSLIWVGKATVPLWLTPPIWHGHEMVFGFVAAAVAGFLLTAAANWSGNRAIAGVPLIVLFVFWLAGRLAFAGAFVLTPFTMALLDVGFLPALAFAAYWTLRGSGQWRNYGIVLIVTVLAIANIIMHAETLGIVAGMASHALRFAIDLITILVIVISGRITPAFTINALVKAGIPHNIVRQSKTTIPLIISMLLLTVSRPLGEPIITGCLSAFAALLAIVRLYGWQPWLTGRDPLLWSLHLGAAWLCIALALEAMSYLGLPVPATAGLHALTTGAISGTIVAVITRVSLGHTGRPLILPSGAVLCYVLINVAAVVRVVTPLMSIEWHFHAYLVSAVCWSAALLLFTGLYWHILTTPRQDGAPG
jgi:uncharacterized protein involved in response to NO